MKTYDEAIDMLVSMMNETRGVLVEMENRQRRTGDACRRIVIEFTRDKALHRWMFTRDAVAEVYGVDTKTVDSDVERMMAA